MVTCVGILEAGVSRDEPLLCGTVLDRTRKPDGPISSGRQTSQRRLTLAVAVIVLGCSSNGAVFVKDRGMLLGGSDD
jgi:hypothetical protein